MKTLYFAYGSNMLKARLEQRVGEVTKKGNFKVHGFKLTFNAGQSAGFANMEMTGNHKDFVEGVVYEMESEQLRKLDHCEGTPHFYIRACLPYNEGKGHRILFFYTSINPMYRTELPPTAQYITTIIDGCKENCLKHTLKIAQGIEVSNEIDGIIV